jgi:hypothetical protein
MLVLARIANAKNVIVKIVKQKIVPATNVNARNAAVANNLQKID